jgi:hypothetical protein
LSFFGNPLNLAPESARWRSGQYGCHSVYRETARVEKTISLLDFFTAPASIFNKRGREWRKPGAREEVYKRNGAAVVRRSSAFSFKPAHPHPHIYRG